MEERLFRILLIAVVAAIAGIVYRIAGNNRREEQSVPVGMKLLTNKPFIRYFLYAMGVVFFLMFGGIMALPFLMGDGDQVREFLGTYILVGVLDVVILLLFLLLGYSMYARHIYFNDKKMVIGRLFRAPVTLEWSQVGQIKSKRGYVRLYDGSGKKRVEARPGMVGFETFRALAEQKCGQYGI